MFDWFTGLIYFGAILILIIAIWVEKKEIYCCNGEAKCKYGHGASYYHGKVNHNDSYDEILRKIRITSRYDEASVYWRRSIIFTILLIFTLLPLVLHEFPNGYQVLVSFIVIYIFIYSFLCFYRDNVSKYATKQLSENLKKL